MSASKNKITLGSVEEVMLLPWGIQLLARIDTGAAKSSLDARKLTVAGDVAEFSLPEEYGVWVLRLPIIEWRHLRTKGGLRRRPVVQIEICLGPRRLRTKVALEDRTGLTYPLLIGRNTLKGHFVVDVDQKETISPACPSD